MECVRKALDLCIATFDTADARANTKAETMLGKALKNDRGLSRKHVIESINGSLPAPN